MLKDVINSSKFSYFTFFLVSIFFFLIDIYIEYYRGISINFINNFDEGIIIEKYFFYLMINCGVFLSLISKVYQGILKYFLLILGYIISFSSVFGTVRVCYNLYYDKEILFSTFLITVVRIFRDEEIKDYLNEICNKDFNVDLPTIVFNKLITNTRGSKILANQLYQQNKKTIELIIGYQKDLEYLQKGVKERIIDFFSGNTSILGCEINNTTLAFVVGGCFLLIAGFFFCDYIGLFKIKLSYSETLNLGRYYRQVEINQRRIANIQSAMATRPKHTLSGRVKWGDTNFLEFVFNKSKGKKLGFSNGNKDIIHYQNLEKLREARISNLQLKLDSESIDKMKDFL